MKLKVVAVCWICVRAWKRIKSLHYAGNNLLLLYLLRKASMKAEIQKWSKLQETLGSEFCEQFLNCHC